MQAVNAVYIRMNNLTREMGMVSGRLYHEIRDLNEKMSGLAISWEGEAYEEYHRVLMEDLSVMLLISLEAVIMYRLLRASLERYQGMEGRIKEMIGGLV